MPFSFSVPILLSTPPVMLVVSSSVSDAPASTVSALVASTLLMPLLWSSVRSPVMSIKPKPLLLTVSPSRVSVPMAFNVPVLFSAPFFRKLVPCRFSVPILLSIPPVMLVVSSSVSEAPAAIVSALVASTLLMPCCGRASGRR